MTKQKPGWYSPYDQPYLQRYWDGAQWTGEELPHLPAREPSGPRWTAAMALTALALLTAPVAWSSAETAREATVSASEVSAVADVTAVQTISHPAQPRRGPYETCTPTVQLTVDGTVLAVERTHPARTPCPYEVGGTVAVIYDTSDPAGTAHMPTPPSAVALSEAVVVAWWATLAGAVGTALWGARARRKARPPRT